MYDSEKIPGSKPITMGDWVNLIFYNPYVCLQIEIQPIVLIVLEIRLGWKMLPWKINTKIMSL